MLSGWLEFPSEDEKAALKNLRPSYVDDTYEDIASLYSNLGDKMLREDFLKLIGKIRA